MNIKMANAIPLSVILEKIGHKPVKTKGHEAWYHSPLRTDKTASLHIHIVANIWYDFGEAKGGDVIHFVSAFLASRGKSHTTTDALRWLENIIGSESVSAALRLEPVTEHPSALELRKLTPLENSALLYYLRKRGINLLLARKYLREALVYNANTGKEFPTLAIRNENEGFELRNAFFKGCIAPKSITFIRGSKVLPDEVHVFEGVMDFLSALSYEKGKRFEGDVIILNSVVCLPQAYPYIRNYTYKVVKSWMDNDAIGDKTTATLRKFAQENGIGCISMNRVYSGYKDVNEWHVKRKGLEPA